MSYRKNPRQRVKITERCENVEHVDILATFCYLTKSCSFAFPAPVRGAIFLSPRSHLTAKDTAKNLYPQMIFAIATRGWKISNLKFALPYSRGTKTRRRGKHVILREYILNIRNRPLLNAT